MNTIAIVVAAVVFLLLGIGLSLLAVFCYAMLSMMRKMESAAETVSRTVTEAVKELNVFRDARLLQATSDLHRLVESFPSIMGGLKEFNKLWGAIGKTILSPEAIAESLPVPGAPPPPTDTEGAFFGYSEAKATQHEVEEELRRQKLVITEEQMAGMRTEE